MSLRATSPHLASLVLFLGFTLPASRLPGADTPAEDAPRPNIVLILCDDLGYSDVSFNGCEDIRTPKLDELAHGGTIFQSAYVAHPFCGPSRMGMMSGRYPHAYGAPFNLPQSGLGLVEYNRKGIPVGETLISTVLQRAGYFTGAIGKWHMGIEPEFHPNNRGFDDYYGFLGGGHKYFPEVFHPAYERQKSRGEKWINDYLHPLEHNGTPVRETEYVTDGLSREAARFIRDASEKDKPFFLYVAYNAPHSPLEATEEDLQHYQHIKDKKRRTYAAMVHAVDRGVGEITDALKKTDAFENTLIVFLSDNGGKLSLGATNRPLRQGKGSVLEGGYRVPMFFHWPRKVPAGAHFTPPVTVLDFYPTFAKLAGAVIPEGKVLDGCDLWPSVTGGGHPREGKPIFTVRHRHGFSDVGVRRDGWKLARLSHGPWQLYRIDEDLSESHDVSGQNPEIVRELVESVKLFGETHTAPQWFYSAEERDQWGQKNMPRYEISFQLNE